MKMKKLYPNVKRIGGMSIEAQAQAQSCTRRTVQAEHRNDEPTNFLRLGIVLGLCALAVVTGGAPQVFGGVLDALKPIVLKGKDGTLSDDGGRQAKYEGCLRQVDENVSEHNRILAEMRRKEIENIKEALSCEHYAYFCLGIAAIKLKEASEKAESTLQELERAKGEAKGVISAEVKKLEKNFKANLNEKVLASQMYQYQKCVAAQYLNTARVDRERARSAREQRIAHLTGVVNAYIDGRQSSYEDARKALDDPKCTIVRKEQIRVMALQDLIIWASDDGGVEDRVVEQIDDAIESHTDNRWRDYADHFNNDVLLYTQLQAKYIPKKVGYDHKNTTPFMELIARLDDAFGGANELQGDTRLHWEGEDDYRAA
jgi:hypothetical protein